jgi:CBS domain-containing protein
MIGLGFLALFVQGALSGLWLIFLGWFLLNAARGEEEQVMMRRALTGLRVGDAMTPDATLVPGWITVDEFMRSYILPGQRATAFPLKTFDGALDGLVTLAQLTHVTPEERHSRRVRDVCVGIDQVAKVSPAEPVTSVLDRFSMSAEGQMLVIDGGKLVGRLSPADITRVLSGRRRPD